MLRVELRERGRPALPAMDLDGDDLELGAAPGARIRLPAGAAAAVHVRLWRAAGAWRWRALADVEVDGAPRAAGEGGEVGEGVRFALGGYVVAIAPAPAGAPPSPPARTESLARELARALLGDGAAPELIVERGPRVGARRALPPPPARVVVGRGDDAGWVLLDEDLSRAHAELRRDWDGVWIADLGSKNGTAVDGAPAAPGGTRLVDGALVELGAVALRFHDPAERHLGGAAPAAPRAEPAAGRARATPAARGEGGPAVIFYGAALVAAAALAALGWVLLA